LWGQGIGMMMVERIKLYFKKLVNQNLCLQNLKMNLEFYEKRGGVGGGTILNHSFFIHAV
jgi:hypothetical protein